MFSNGGFEYDMLTILKQKWSALWNEGKNAMTHSVCLGHKYGFLKMTRYYNNWKSAENVWKLFVAHETERKQLEGSSKFNGADVVVWFRPDVFINWKAPLWTHFFSPFKDRTQFVDDEVGKKFTYESFGK